MDYHMHYPSNEPDVARQEENSVEPTATQRKEPFYKRRRILIGIYIFSAVAFFLSLFYFLGTKEKNYLQIENNERRGIYADEEINSDLLFTRLLNSKNGRKFFLTKLEELIISYEKEKEKEKEKDNDLDVDVKDVTNDNIGKEVLKEVRKEANYAKGKINKKGVDPDTENKLVDKIVHNLRVNNANQELSFLSEQSDVHMNIVLFILENMDAVIHFDDFTKQFKKEYTNAEEKYKRFLNFVTNFIRIKEHNKKENVYFKQKINHFSDMSYDEIRLKMLTLKPSDSNKWKRNILTDEEMKELAKQYKTGIISSVHSNSVTPVSEKADPDVDPEIDPDADPDSTDPDNFDWRNYNVAKNIKDQGICGSCWAFSTVGAVETIYAIRQKKNVSLSEQQLIDCDTWDDGCNGGLLNAAFDYVLKADGLCTENDYPYIGLDNHSCASKKCSTHYPIRDIRYIPFKRLKYAVRHVGPISVNVCATVDFIYYSNGIFNGDCADNVPNHAVLVIGYGVEKSYNTVKKDYENVYYYIIKNSWGEKWGENGYMRIITNEDGLLQKCALGNEAYIPLIKFV